MKPGIRTLSLLLAAAFLIGCRSTSGGPSGVVSPVQATWLYGRYTIPSKVTKNFSTLTFQQSIGAPAWTALAENELKPDAKVPVVLYLHGCSGFTQQADIYRDLLISEGYAVFAPDSFQRPGRKKCRDQGPLRDRVLLRSEEVEYALKEIRKLTWVDQEHVILMGFSEGGNTTDSWSKPGFAAHIILGSACTLVGGVPAAPAGVPVLAIVGEKDRFRPGLSCKILRTVGGSRSIVISGGQHAIAGFKETRQAIKAFLRQCCP